MLDTGEARAAILSSMPEFPAESATLDIATGRVLRQAVRAERDQPPFDRVMMDGIALRHSDLASGIRRFPVQALQAAGDRALALQEGHCIEIMTGASLPTNANCIIPVERISVEDGIATVEHGYSANAGQYIHPRASDHAASSELLSPGRRISPLDIAIIASCGLTEVSVSRRPVIRIVSTGNELVPAGKPIEAHQIRQSNGPALQAMLRARGYADCGHDHLADDRESMRHRIGAHLADADVLILSGGVSMGKADFVPTVLDELGVQRVFHKVTQRPGMPMWFGMAHSRKAVFALPGNPVSALVCCRQYVIPALEAASTLAASPPEFAALTENIRFDPDLTCFQPVRLVSNAAGQLLAIPVKTNTSGDFTALSASDGYVELEREKNVFPAGTPLILHRW